MSALVNCLSRLESVRETGSGHYRAKCPAHDSGPDTLAITIGRNGSVLLKCFAGCDTGDVVSAMGLQFSDLYPDAGRDRARDPRCGPRVHWRAVCAALLHEFTVAEIGATDLVNGVELTAEDGARVLQALARIDAQRRALHGQV